MNQTQSKCGQKCCASKKGDYPRQKFLPASGADYPRQQYPSPGGDYPRQPYPSPGGDYPRQPYPYPGGDYPRQQYPSPGAGGDYPRQQYSSPGANIPFQQQMILPPPPPGFKMNEVYTNQPGTLVGPQTQAVTSIHEALNFSPVSVIDKMLTDKPAAISERGFNGQGPLHRAVMRIEPEILKVLLAHKADPNFTNNHQETPLHFAAKRGNPSVLRHLVEAGGDVAALDRAGKGLLHHACHGGSVPMMHYLLTVFGLSPKAEDQNLKTPLHIVCEHGNEESFEYLARKERSDLAHRDSAGNTVLHICARSGHPWLCWRILQEGGVQLLQQRNNNGETPLDLARKETQTPRQKSVVSLLQQFSAEGKPTQKVECPRWLWYWYLCCPFILYGATGLLCQMTELKGYVMTLGATIILTIVFQQRHRIQHTSRLPNPMYAGMFGAGLFYTTLCYLMVILPVIFSEDLPLTVLCMSLTLSVWYYYYRTLTTDPGVQKYPRQRQDGTYCDIQDIACGDINMEALCKTCEIVPPVLTKHCKLCVRCYNQMDHHCLFLYRCIAINNHRLFILLILSALGAMLTFEYVSVLYIQRVYPMAQWSTELWYTIYQNQPMVWSIMIANALSVLWGVNLLKFQLKVVSKGQTTFFQPNRGSTDFTFLQRCKNVVLFLIGSKRYRRDPLILQNV